MDELLKQEVFEWTKSILIAVILALLIKKFIFNTTYVDGVSMEPTLKHSDRLISVKIPLYSNNIKRGDIINFDAPDSENIYIKRVIGIPGDIIDIKDGIVYLNGEELVEDYIEDNIYTETRNKDHWELGEDEVFVLGDNRRPYKSNDSRLFGPIHIKSIKGINYFRYYPFDSNFGKLTVK